MHKAKMARTNYPGGYLGHLNLYTSTWYIYTNFCKRTVLWMVVFLNDGLQMNPESQLVARKISFIALTIASNITYFAQMGS